MQKYSRGAARCLRAGTCAALLTLLALSSYAGAGANRVQAVSVPVMIETVSREALSAASLEETRKRLESVRAEALVQLQSVLDDPRTDEETAAGALRKKAEIAKHMDTEASVARLLLDIGFGEAAVSAGEKALSIIVPWQIAENEQNRLQMIDAASGQTGLPPECIKIILAKK